LFFLMQKYQQKTNKKINKTLINQKKYGVNKICYWVSYCG
jgi:hypothetical protein